MSAGADTERLEDEARVVAETEDAESTWRGVAVDRRGDEEISDHVSGMLRARSRRLLGELLRPHRRWIWVLVGVVLVENLARLSIPYLVKEGIDLGIPPIRESGDATLLYGIVGVVVVAIAVQAVTRQTFLVLSGRIGQDMLFEVRRRVFRHFQKLSPAFHDEYTSGRVISRQTSDVDAIYEMLESGFDGLVTAVLTLVGTSIVLLFLRRAAGPGRAVQLPVPVAADQLVPQGDRAHLPGHPGEGRARDRALRRVHGRDPGGAGVPPRAPQPGDLRRRQRPVPPRQPAGLPALRVVHARGEADRQHHHRGHPALRRLPRRRRRGHRRRPRRVPALPAAVLRADAGDLDVLQHLPVRLGGVGEALRGARGGAGRPRAGRPGTAHRRPRRGALRPRPLRVRRRHARAARPRPERARRPDPRPGGHHRCRQDHDRQAARPVLRPHLGPGAARRRRPAPASTRRPCGRRS